MLWQCFQLCIHVFYNINLDYFRKYQQQGQSPIVFIVSDSAGGGDGNERLLFPKEIQAELHITSIR